MRLVSFVNGFGRVEGDLVIPMGHDLVEYLATGDASNGAPVPLADVRLLAPVPRPGSRVSKGDALSYVAGYTCVNDVSARDLQFRSSQWMLGQAIDTFLPCGPWLVASLSRTMTLERAGT